MPSRLSPRTASTASPDSTREFSQGNGSLRVVVATYFGMAVMNWVNGLPSVRYAQAVTKFSYVRRPNSIAEVPVMPWLMAWA